MIAITARYLARYRSIPGPVVVVESLTATIVRNDEIVVNRGRGWGVAWLFGAVANVGEERLAIPTVAHVLVF
jgi:hypothetical protein